MSTFYKRPCTCFVCGSSSDYYVCGSTNVFGCPDLDLRPSEMKRSTMGTWVHVCPKCGYVSASVSDPTSVSKEYLRSEEYRSCGGNKFPSRLAELFFRQYMIRLRDGDKFAAFHAVLHAAWDCDDENDSENAVLCRKLSLPLLDELLCNAGEEVGTLLVMKADIMRRAGLFTDLKREYSSVRPGEKLLEQILAFELALAEKEDAACYRVSDVPGVREE